MAAHRRPRRAMNEINVVPYIDVMLVLLVIFMVTAPMMQQGTINLPTVGAATDREVRDRPLRVQIDGEGQFKLIDDGGASQSAPDATALATLVTARLAERPDRPVVIAADKGVKYELVMSVMDALKQARVARVGLLVEQRSGR
ncbi:protein TolR [Chitiniphilus purpureus]|uniref:Protein TolR n=1 Tax=Chitiniphilus purpureus TaxID=2981137 RepID=A0ABY6DMQ8_9NEIS|nr:protein TolR [Chitiniphilus sp. CD1]UXY15642.1 protein TolR [Chitiniphilus sp. CD1]